MIVVISSEQRMKGGVTWDSLFGAIHSAPFSCMIGKIQLTYMVRIAVGIVAVGAGMWVLAGSLYLSSENATFAHAQESWAGRSAQVASAAWFSELFMDIPKHFLGFFGQYASQGRVELAFGEANTRSYSSAGATPSCEISVDKPIVPYNGLATVTWTSRGAREAVLQGDKKVPLNGSAVLKEVTSTQAIALTVSDGHMSFLCHTVITVETRVVPRPQCLISADPSLIPSGGFSDLSWGSEGAVSAYIVNIGPVDVHGGMRVTPSSNTEYVMKVVGEGGTEATCSTDVLLY